MSALKKMNIDLDRRVLAELAAEDSEAFSNLVSLAKENAA
jgi:ribosomal protein L20